MIHYVSLRPGARVVHQDTHYAVVQALDLETVLVKEVATGVPRRLSIRELEPPPADDGNEAPAPIELAAVSDEDWKIAQRRFDAIQPLLGSYGRTREDVRKQAREYGVNVATIYRWINDFGRTGKLSALLPSQRSAARGRSRLNPDVETILVSVIEEDYLTNQKATIARTAREVKNRCERAQLDPPHPGTVRNRILKLSDQQRLKSRYGSRAARDRFDPAVDKFPGADYPLAVVQIDHTKVNVIVVDDEERLPIGRAWLTVAVDVYSRVIVGYYLSLDPPSAMSVGLCLAHAIFPKDSWLAARGIEAAWPIWGVMDAVHADNAKEFRGEMLSLAASELNFRLEWRPVKNPKYGGHIEALCGTLKRGLEELPGTTFSGPSERQGYDSEKEAAMTFSELELWLAKYITEVYHQRVHSELGVSPLKKLEQGVFGDNGELSAGLRDVPQDETEIRLQLMPYELKTVQQYGIRWDYVNYYSDVLRPWINAKNPEGDGKNGGKFIVRRDPRDISKVYFYDPELRQHFEIPYRNLARPTITLWELKAARKRLVDQGVEDIDEDKIFRAHDELHEIAEKAKRETKAARRRRQRKVESKKAQTVRLDSDSGDGQSDNPLDQAESLDFDNIQPFDEIEELDERG